jgi:hypothetical protein
MELLSMKILSMDCYVVSMECCVYELSCVFGLSCVYENCPVWDMSFLGKIFL